MSRHSASQKQPSAPVPGGVGRLVFAPTGEVALCSPLAEASGRYGTESVLFVRGGRTFVRPYVVPPAPNSPAQLSCQDRFRLVQRSWKDLPAAVRRAWDGYALRHLFAGEAGLGVRTPGLNAWCRTQTFRLGWGGELATAAPAALPPPAVLAVTEEEPPAPGTLVLRVRHFLPSTEGLRVVFDMTPAMPTPNRHPREMELRRAAQSEAASFFPLGPDGADYFIEMPRFVIEPGQRYGVRVRLLTADGVAGPPLLAELMRRAGPAAEDGGLSLSSASGSHHGLALGNSRQAEGC